MKRKKERMLILSKGVNKVELNKIIKKSTPEDLLNKKVFYFLFFEMKCCFFIYFLKFIKDNK